MARPTHPLEIEICSVLGKNPVKTSCKETRRDFLLELMEGINELDDTTSESLSAEAIKWYNDCVDRVQRDLDPIDFWEYTNIEEAQQSVSEIEYQMPAAKIAEALERAGKKRKRPGRPKKTKEKEVSAVREARKIIIDYYKNGKYISSPELAAELHRKGLDLSRASINFIIYEVKQTLRILIEKNLVNLQEPKRKRNV